MRWLLAVLLTLVLASPVAAQDKPDWVMRAGMVSLATVTTADLETTGRALERGFQEKNPILRPFADTPGMAGLVSGAMSGGIALGAYSLHKKGKKKEAKIIVWTWTAVRAFVVWHNIKELSK